MGDRYKPGDRVFAKMKGYQPWPAKVQERLPVKAETYKIYFYGTYEAAKVKVDQIFDYNEENINKYGKQRRAKIKEAMQEIAENINIEDPKMEEESPTLMEEFASAAPPPADQSDSDDNEGELLIDEGPPPILKKESKPPTLTPAPPMPRMTPAPPRMTPAPNQKVTPGGSVQKTIPVLRSAPVLTPKASIETPEPPVPTPPKQNRRGSRGLTKKDLTLSAGISTPPPPPAETTPQPEIVSRSGRKIKPKRFADDELPMSSSAKGGDEAKETPPAGKRTRRTASQVAAAKASGKPGTATPEPTTPPTSAIPEKPKLTRGRSKLSESGEILSSEPTPPVPRARGKPGPRGNSTLVPVPTSTKSLRSRTSTSAEIPKTSSPSLREYLPNFGEEDGQEYVDDKENDDTLSPGENQWFEQEDDGEGEGEEGVEEEEEMGSEGDEESEPEDAEGDADRRIPVTAKNGVEVEIGLNHLDRPETFESNDVRIQWDLASARNVLKVRKELEKSESSATAFLDQVAKAVVSKEEEVKDVIARKRKEKISFKIKELRKEGEMVEMIGEIIHSLSEKAGECDHAIELLDRLTGHGINALLLKKHPQAVNVIGRVRNYVGNADVWEYNDEQREELKMKCEIIRTKSTALYETFKVLLGAQPDVPFKTTLAEKIEEFRMSVGDLTEKEILSLVKDPTDPAEIEKRAKKGQFKKFQVIGRAEQDEGNEVNEGDDGDNDKDNVKDDTNEEKDDNDSAKGTETEGGSLPSEPSPENKEMEVEEPEEEKDEVSLNADAEVSASSPLQERDQE